MKLDDSFVKKTADLSVLLSKRLEMYKQEEVALQVRGIDAIAIPFLGTMVIL